MKNFPMSTYPTGWFMLDWSSQLAPGTIKKLTIFGEEVILYRTVSGQLRLVGAYCPHLGANLGHAKIDGELIRCGFHGWAFDTDGYNQDIPFCSKANRLVRLNVWHVKEQDGIILVWHDAGGREPFWDWPGVPEFGDRESYYDTLKHFSGIHRVLPHQAFENIPDIFHFPFVHGAGVEAEIIDWREEFPVLHTKMRLTMGAGKERTWLTPDGPVDTYLTGEATLGLLLVRIQLPHLPNVTIPQLVAITPINRDESMIFSSVSGPRDPSSPDEPAGIIRALMETQNVQVEGDFAIWGDQIYVEHPPFAEGENTYYARTRRFWKGYWPDSESPVFPAYARADMSSL